METNIFIEFMESDYYMIYGVISLFVYLVGGVIIAWKIATESRYDRECRKAEKAYEIYKKHVMDHKKD